MTTNYESRKDGKVFTLIEEANAEGKVTLQSNDDTITVTESTLKRWYKPTDKQMAVKETKSAVATMEKPVKVVEGIKLDPQEFKGTVSDKTVVEKTGDVITKISTKTEPLVITKDMTPKATKKAIKASTLTFETACKANEALVTSLLQYGQKQGCEIIAHQVDTVLRLNGKNIMMAFVRKAKATMCFNYLSIPADIYGEIADKVTVTPDEWKKTLNVWVPVTEDNQKILLDCIDSGVKYITDKAIAKENVLKAKAEKAAKKPEKVK